MEKKEILTKEEYYSTAIAMVQEAKNGEMSLPALRNAMEKNYYLNASILNHLLQSSVAQTDMPPKQILPAPAWVDGEVFECHFAAILFCILDAAKLKFESMTTK